jgi:hypothetical protein
VDAIPLSSRSISPKTIKLLTTTFYEQCGEQIAAIGHKILAYTLRLAQLMAEKYNCPYAKDGPFVFLSNATSA